MPANRQAAGIGEGSCLQSSCRRDVMTGCQYVQRSQSSCPAKPMERLGPLQRKCRQQWQCSWNGIIVPQATSDTL
jgi:hypothetical protein